MINLLACVLGLGLPADPGPCWVFLKDKGPDERAAIAQVSLGERCAARRALRRTAPGLVDLRDVPVLDGYVDAIKGVGATVRVTSRWLNGVSVEATPGQLDAIARMPFVDRIEPVRAGRRVEPEAGQDEGAGVAGGEYGFAQTQLELINLIAVHGMGYTGEGVVIGVLDTGFVLTHDAFNEPGHEIEIIAAHDFINDDDNVGIEAGDPDSQHWHGTIILGAMGAYLPFSLIGGAPDASFILCKTEDTSDETQIEEDYYVAGLEFAEANGADVITSSLGYIDWYTQDDLDGQTAVTTIGVNIAIENGVHCCTAAGNQGHDQNPLTSHLMAPSDAFKVISVGAVLPTGEDAGFSSDGPTADGRVKPEVLAQGDQTWSVDPDDDDGYGEYAGTSMSTPLMASTVACLTQAHPEWTTDQIRTALMSSGDWYELFGEPDPMYVYGYGVPDAVTALAGDCNANAIPDADEIANGDAQDCDGNGVPDECDIEFGTLPDADADGVPDVCLACAADFNADGELNILDFVAFQNAFEGADPKADCNDSGGLDILDFICFQGLFQAGCD